MTDNPAALLRRAAAALRDAAEQATHEQGPRWLLGETKGSRSKVVLDHPDSPTVLIETWAARLERVNAYLTLVGPATGTALAEWLESAAVDAEEIGHDFRATNVARAVLGEAAESDLSGHDVRCPVCRCLVGQFIKTEAEARRLIAAHECPEAPLLGEVDE